VRTSWILAGALLLVGVASLWCGSAKTASVRANESTPRAAPTQPEPRMLVADAPRLQGRGDASKGRAAQAASRGEGEASWVTVAEEELPDDPVGVGACTLVLAFVDDALGEPFATGFDLWRLDAPGNPEWTHGDQRQTRHAEGVEAFRIPDLPAGRYRLHVHGARKAGPDPPAFEVSGALTRVRVVVAAPPEIQVRLLVFDERGNRMDRGRRQARGCGSTSRSPDTPDWVRKRHLTGNRIVGGGRCWCGLGCGGSSRFADPVEAGPDGFDLGAWRGSSRYADRSASACFFFDGHSEVRTRLKSDALPAGPFVALSVPMAWIRERVQLEDGRPATDTDLCVSARCAAVAPAQDADPWVVAAALPIEVWVTRGGRQVGCCTLHLTDAGAVLAPPKDP
jgi:hypothetical protein